MNTEKTIIKCESIFNDDHTHRFSWKRVWNKDKPLAAVIMLNPCLSDNIITDTTTTLVVNNIARLDKAEDIEKESLEADKELENSAVNTEVKPEVIERAVLDSEEESF
jgi:hypothetical protein